MPPALEHLQYLLDTSKHLSYIPHAWSSFPDKNSNKLELIVSLEIENVVQEALILRGTAIEQYPEKNVTFQLEYDPPVEKRTPFHRLDWRPLRPHSNHGQGPSHLKFVLQEDTHLHDFFENRAIADSAFDPFDPRNNLPVAFPIQPEPPTFNDMLAVLCDHFNIINGNRIPKPAWQPRLGPW
jgi:hypothetical protein